MSHVTASAGSALFIRKLSQRLMAATGNEIPSYQHASHNISSFPRM